MELASLLATDTPVRVVDDIHGACIQARADVLVSRKLSNFDLTNQAVPHHFDPETPEKVAALVGTGPNSLFAGQVAVRLASRLDVPVELVTAHSNDQERMAGGRALTDISRQIGAGGRLVKISEVSDLIHSVGERSLLVFGAAGGRLLQRLFFGTGVRLRSQAPSGAVIVQAAPMRVFRRMVDPSYVSGHMSVAEASRVTDAPVVAVVDGGRLIGVVRRESLAESDPEALVSSVMEEGASAAQEDSLEELRARDHPFERIPVTDEDGMLVGDVTF